MTNKSKKLPNINLPRYDKSNSTKKRIETAKKDYEDGNLIEAFVILNASIEFQLNMIWWMFLINSGFTRKGMTYPDLAYNTLIVILLHVKIFGGNTYSKFKSFKKGRNNVVHYITSIIKPPTKKALDSQFKEGLFCIEFLLKTYGNQMKQLKKKIDEMGVKLDGMGKKLDEKKSD